MIAQVVPVPVHLPETPPRPEVPLAFTDVESTGLDPEVHEVWEVALILRTPGSAGTTEVEHLWQLPVDLGLADPRALDVGRFYDRVGRTQTTNLRIFAQEFAKLTHGAYLVGAVPSFDDAFLRRLLRSNNACPGWNYHLVDVEALAAGWLAATHGADQARPPWKSNDLSLAVGVDPERYDRHTAMGDARWARDIFDAVMGP